MIKKYYLVNLHQEFFILTVIILITLMMINFLICQANSEESIRVELAQLQEDKHMYETTAKESLKKALEEKLEASQNYADMEVRSGK